MAAHHSILPAGLDSQMSLRFPIYDPKESWHVLGTHVTILEPLSLNYFEQQFGHGWESPSAYHHHFLREKWMAPRDIRMSD